MFLEETQLAELLEDLTANERTFAEEFMLDLNPVKAAKRMGLGAPSSHAKAAGEYLNRQRVKKYIAHLKAATQVGKEHLADRVIAELTKIAFQNIGDIIKVDDQGQARLKTIEEIIEDGADLAAVDVSTFADTSTVTKVKPHDKLKALEMLGRHCSLFTDNLNHTNDGEKFDAAPRVNITINHRAAGERLAGHT